MRIYIRHAEKEYDNNKSAAFRFDPNITQEGRIGSMQLADELIKLWGIPKYIICSPYLRCRQTSEALLDQVKYHLINDTSIEIKCSIEVSEYLGNQIKNYPSEEDFYRETNILEPPINETFSVMEKRVRKQRLPTQAKSKIKYCRNCNCKNKDSAKICTQCGVTFRGKPVRRPMK